MRRRRSRLHVLLPVLAGVLLPGHPVLGGAEITGEARIIDGDTVAIGRHRLRLFGIDAPETRQLCTVRGAAWPCGGTATMTLRELVAGRPLACVERGRDRYGRVVAVCRIGALDVNAWMVEAG